MNIIAQIQDSYTVFLGKMLIPDSGTKVSLF